MKDLINYYKDQLDRIKQPKDGYAPTIQIKHESGKTNYLNLCDASAKEIVNWLKEHYNV